MPGLILLNAVIHYRGIEMSGQLNQISFQYNAELLDSTTFGPSKTTRSRVKGLKQVEATAQGFWTAATTVSGSATERYDKHLFDKIFNLNPGYLTIGANGNTPGSLAYFFEAQNAEYSVGGAVGDILPLNSSFQGVGQLVRGTYGMVQTITTDGITDGTAIDYGLVVVTNVQTMNFVVHLLRLDGAGGRTANVDLQSDDNSGFTSAITRVSMVQFNSSSLYDSYYSSVAGPITDTFWRIRVTTANVAGGGLTIAAVFGIT